MSGDDIEETVAILVSRKHPDSIRIRPSRGDGGIDLLLPQQDGTSHVLQVKKFAENLTSSQKNQISNSLARLGKFAEEHNLVVSRWDLVTPLDPTNENLEWLAGLPRVQGVVPGWLGRHYVDGLAAEFPDVIDYHLHGGRQRLQDAMNDLTILLRQVTGSAAQGPLSAGDTESVLTAWSRQINAYDPHYSYDFHVTSDPVDLSTIAPDRLAMVWQSGAAGVCVTIAARSRFADAANVRPIQGTVNIRVPQGSDQERAVRDFGDYGADLVLTGEHFDFTADAPGGLTPPSSSPDAVLRITMNPAPGMAPQEARWTLIAPDDTPLAATTVVIESAAPGLSGTGGRMDGREINGVFDVTMYVNTSTQEGHITLTTGELHGKRLEDVQPGIRFLANFTAPNRLAISNPYRPGPERGSIPIRQQLEPGAAAMNAIVEALLEIQQAVGQTIRMPQLINEPLEQFLPLITAARLLRGEEVSCHPGALTWTAPQDFPQDIGPQEIQAMLAGGYVFTRPLTVTIEGTEFNLGTYFLVIPAVRMREAPTGPVSPGTCLILDPAAECILRMDPPA